MHRGSSTPRCCRRSSLRYGLPCDRVQAHRLWPRDPGPQHLQASPDGGARARHALAGPEYRSDGARNTHLRLGPDHRTCDKWASQVGFTNPESCYLILRDYMSLAVHLRRFTQERPAVERYIMAFTYLRLRLIQDHASGLLRTTVKRDAAQMSTQ